ncbi:MAG: peptidoglycan-binding domain-containing protein [Microbacterium sp.]
MTGVLILLAGAVGWLARGVDAATPDPLSEPLRALPVVIDVESTDRVITTAAAVVVHTRPGPVIASPKDGVLTSLDIVEGSQISNGSRVFAVNDVPVLAMVSSAPLYRSLAVGDRGPDVVRLQQWLASLGYNVETDGRYGSETTSAVADFRQKNGLPGSGGAAFDLGWVTWVGPTPLAPARLSVGIGATVGAHTSIAEGEAVAVSVTVAELASYPPGVESILEVGTASVPYVSASGVITDTEAASAVAAALGIETEGSGRIRSASSENVIVLPAGSVVTDSNGAMCVYPDVDAAPIPVTVVGSTVGTQSITPIDGLASVLSNPTSVIRSPSCG